MQALTSLGEQFASDFLKRFKKKHAAGQFTFVPRKQNLGALAYLGITPAAAEQVILGLSTTNYCRGPECDDDGSAGEVWIFGTVLEGTQVYIKLKLDDLVAKCISFHPAGTKMNFPLLER